MGKNVCYLLKENYEKIKHCSILLLQTLVSHHIKSVSQQALLLDMPSMQAFMPLYLLMLNASFILQFRKWSLVMFYIWGLSSDRLLSNDSVATQSMILEMSSWISKGSAQNKPIVITANQTLKRNWSITGNIKSDFFPKMIWVDSAYVSILFSLHSCWQEYKYSVCISKKPNIQSPVKIELNNHIIVWAWQHHY